MPKKVAIVKILAYAAKIERVPLTDRIITEGSILKQNNIKKKCPPLIANSCDNTKHKDHSYRLGELARVRKNKGVRTGSKMPAVGGPL